MWNYNTAAASKLSCRNTYSWSCVFFFFVCLFLIYYWQWHCDLKSPEAGSRLCWTYSVAYFIVTLKIPQREVVGEKLLCSIQRLYGTYSVAIKTVIKLMVYWYRSRNLLITLADFFFSVTWKIHIFIILI